MFLLWCPYINKCTYFSLTEILHKSNYTLKGSSYNKHFGQEEQSFSVTNFIGLLEVSSIKSWLYSIHKNHVDKRAPKKRNESNVWGKTSWNLKGTRVWKSVHRSFKCWQCWQFPNVYNIVFGKRIILCYKNCYAFCLINCKTL